MARLVSDSVVTSVLNGGERNVAAGIAFIQVVCSKIVVLVEDSQAHRADVV